MYLTIIHFIYDIDNPCSNDSIQTGSSKFKTLNFKIQFLSNQEIHQCEICAEAFFKDDVLLKYSKSMMKRQRLSIRSVYCLQTLCETAKTKAPVDLDI